VFWAQVLVPSKSKLIEETSREFVGLFFVCVGVIHQGQSCAFRRRSCAAFRSQVKSKLESLEAAEVGPWDTIFTFERSLLMYATLITCFSFN
jgi:hypothetical protein